MRSPNRRHLKAPAELPEFGHSSVHSKQKKTREHNIFTEVKSEERLLTFYISSNWIFWAWSRNRKVGYSWKNGLLKSTEKD